MMYGWNGWGMWFVGPVMLVLIIWLVVWLIRDTTGSITDTANGPRSVLEDRFAQGEIDRDEYLERLSTLEKR